MGDEYARASSAEVRAICRHHASWARGRLPHLESLAAQGNPTIAPSFSALGQQLLKQLTSVANDV